MVMFKSDSESLMTQALGLFVLLVFKLKGFVNLRMGTLVFRVIVVEKVLLHPSMQAA